MSGHQRSSFECKQHSNHNSPLEINATIDEAKSFRILNSSQFIIIIITIIKCVTVLCCGCSSASCSCNQLILKFENRRNPSIELSLCNQRKVEQTKWTSIELNLCEFRFQSKADTWKILGPCDILQKNAKVRLKTALSWNGREPFSVAILIAVQQQPTDSREPKFHDVKPIQKRQWCWPTISLWMLCGHQSVSKH